MTFVSFFCGFMIGATWYAWKHNRDLEKVRLEYDNKCIKAIIDTELHCKLAKEQDELNQRAEKALADKDLIFEKVLGKMKI